MGKKNLVPCLIILMMFSCASSDFAQDKKECQGQLASLSPCLNFVSGEAKGPSPGCCTELKKEVGKSTFCLCVLVRDRNDPSLGFKINATRALTLGPLCQLHSNTTVCPALLHLSPNSPEAQVFEQFGNAAGLGNSTSAGETIPSSNTKLSAKGIITAFLVWTSSVELLEAARMF